MMFVGPGVLAERAALALFNPSKKHMEETFYSN
jgi:hypothetical protein